MKAAVTPAAWADAFVDRVARHKASMLAGSVVVTGAIAVVALFLAFGEDDGTQLTTLAAEIGGYVAIVGLVLGLPALGYAMVTDRAVDVLSAAMLESMRDKIDDLLGRVPKSLLPDDHHVQLFRPGPGRTHLLPVYDPKGDGPSEGWEIDPDFPQAVTGSAWVKNEYYYLRDEALHDSALRLTRKQRKRFGTLTGVAATPVRDASRQPIAVLTLLTKSTHPRIGAQDFIDLHVALAEHLAQILRPDTLDLQQTVPSDASNLPSGAIELTPDVVAEAMERTPLLDDTASH
jgi:hypothetical protein